MARAKHVYSFGGGKGEGHNPGPATGFEDAPILWGGVGYGLQIGRAHKALQGFKGRAAGAVH